MGGGRTCRRATGATGEAMRGTEGSLGTSVVEGCFGFSGDVGAIGWSFDVGAIGWSFGIGAIGWSNAKSKTATSPSDESVNTCWGLGFRV